ncbi:MAG: sensor histidine kinase, partial [Lachnospiraceae bacterium]|nr:sensor histidine kinase [Lachnospiraceae bacterium]
HGIGMEKEQIAHIKEAFYRVDKARSRAAGGAGLGLAICERIIKMHHADMLFISEPGAGTTVKLLFPAR